jgi:phosphoribosylformylglycinamidine synthase
MSSSKHKIGIVQFPGSNCDQDCIETFDRVFGIKLKPIWHTETSLGKMDGIILPGGFSYGDYLRSGALATHSPVMKAVHDHAKKGGAIIGICNGFQILTEAQLLPGVLLTNESRRFVCKQVYLTSEKGKHKAQKSLSKVYKMPVAHGMGRFYINKDGMKKLKDKGQIWLKYVNESGKIVDDANPNGSLNSIAGIISENGKIMGLMPHPERAADGLLGSDDGIEVLKAFLTACG